MINSKPKNPWSTRARCPKAEQEGYIGQRLPSHLVPCVRCRSIRTASGHSSGLMVFSRLAGSAFFLETAPCLGALPSVRAPAGVGRVVGQAQLHARTRQTVKSANEERASTAPIQASRLFGRKRFCAVPIFALGGFRLENGRSVALRFFSRSKA